MLPHPTVQGQDLKMQTNVVELTNVAAFAGKAYRVQ